MKRIVFAVTFVALCVLSILTGFGGSAHAASSQHATSHLSAKPQQKAASQDLVCPVARILVDGRAWCRADLYGRGLLDGILADGGLLDGQLLDSHILGLNLGLDARDPYYFYRDYPYRWWR
jgi:hypothetical protein